MPGLQKVTFQTSTPMGRESRIMGQVPKHFLLLRITRNVQICTERKIMYCILASWDWVQGGLVKNILLGIK